MERETVAESSLVGVRSDGERFSIRVTVGRPLQSEDGLWACSVGLEGLYERLAPQKSDDSFHALCLGIFLLRNLLNGFLEDGGRLLIAGSDGEEAFPLEAYFPHLRERQE